MSYEGYRFGMEQAARLGRALGRAELTAIEFGVGAGAGLLEMERIADCCEREFGVRFRLFGFDTGTGLPAPEDYRDLPYAWRQGDYAMDEARLRARLKDDTRLVIGDIRADKLLIDELIPPIGFVAFDLDYYSSTTAAIPILGGGHHALLPRTYCHFDDVVGDHSEVHCEWAGELCAIWEFNSGCGCDRGVYPIHGLTAKLGGVAEPWHLCAYVLHIFDHPDYCRYVRE